MYQRPAKKGGGERSTDQNHQKKPAARQAYAGKSLIYNVVFTGYGKLCFTAQCFTSKEVEAENPLPLSNSEALRSNCAAWQRGCTCQKAMGLRQCFFARRPTRRFTANPPPPLNSLNTPRVKFAGEATKAVA